MSFIFECPYCGEMFSEPDDLEHIRSHRLCPGCQASFDDDELEELLPEDDMLEGEKGALVDEDEGEDAEDDERPPEGGFDESDDGPDDEDDDADDQDEENDEQH